MGPALPGVPGQTGSGAPLDRRSHAKRRQAFSTLSRGSFRVLPFLPKVPGSFLSILFPAFCLHCKRELDFPAFTGVCADCWAQLEPWQGLTCSGCGLPATPSFTQRPSGLCDLCQQGAYAFDFARSLTVYSGAARTLIHQMKFRQRERLALALGSALATSAVNGPFRQLAEFARNSEKGIDPDHPGEEILLLVPVPLHPARERERGFNQAEKIARGFASKARRLHPAARIELNARGLRRIRATPAQVGLDFRARQENVRNSFQAQGKDRFRNRIVLLIDDVMTTGATASACARELKNAGARKVMVLTVARATRGTPVIAGARQPSS